MVILIILSKIKMVFIKFEYACFLMIALLANIAKIIPKIQKWKETWVTFFCDNEMKQNKRY